MLVLSRKEGETLVIGDSVVQVVRAGKGRVRLAIAAPRGTPIMRGELTRVATHGQRRCPG